MYYFKQKSNRIKQLLFFCEVSRSVVSRCLKANVILICLGSILLTACNQLPMPQRAGHNLIKGPVAVGQKSVLTSRQANRPVNLSGLWKIGFKDQGEKCLGNMQIQQSNQSFSGQGQDEQNGANFRIEQGQIKGDEIVFLKGMTSAPIKLCSTMAAFLIFPLKMDKYHIWVVIFHLNRMVL